MRVRALGIFLVLGSGVSAAAEPEREAFDDAIDKGLEYLARHQAPNGAWLTAQGPEPAITSLCIMAFLSAGHVPGEGTHGQAIERGIQYVMEQQRPNGLFLSILGERLEMYQHGICTLMLAEVVGMMPDRRQARKLREKLVLAVDVILRAQLRNGEDRGGWRYTVQSPDSDISVTGWQIMALRAAKNTGCDVPAEHIDQAIDYIKRCRDPVTGGYRYQIYGRVTIPCTGTSMLALSLMDKDYTKSNDAYRAASSLLKYPLNPREQHFFYGIYYTSQAMFQVGIEKKTSKDNRGGVDVINNYWITYRKILHRLLLVQNPPKAAGFWSGFGWDDLKAGPNYCTAMAILALTVEYRYLPIYQRGEEPAENE